MITKLYPYQADDVETIESFGGILLDASEMGTGKTLKVLKWYHDYLHPNGPAVVVCPATLKWNWAAEAAHHLNLRAEILEKTTPPRSNGVYASKRGRWIINYDILYAWVDWLRALGPRLVVGDEVQYISNPNSRRGKAFRALARGVPHRLGLSGTPLTHRPAEIFHIAHILWPDKFPSYVDFGWKYCQPEKLFGEWKFRGAANLELLNKKLRRYGFIRRLKKDVLKYLPKKTRTVLPVDISDRAQYNQAVANFIEWLRTYNPAKANPKERAERLVQIGYLKRLAAKLKMPAVIEWIQNYLDGTDSKLIVFGIHKAILGPLHEKFPDSVLLDGAVVGRKRQMVINQFTNDKRTRILFGNIVAAGVGWNGTAAGAVAFAELPWDPAASVQGEDRIHRIGQHNAANIYYLVARNTIEEMLVALLQRKQRILDKVLDGQIQAAGLSTFNELFEAVVAATVAA
jgi:SWI/SNF-related matrix-associated actin-dependent regulator 1 of chromatin subfamily A